jgi:hypothetical protein
MERNDIEQPRMAEINIDEDRSVSVASQTNSEREFQRKNIYNCCGGRVDRRILEYSIQVLIVSVAITFSIVQLFRQAPNTELYVSILSTSIGYAIPSPSISHTKDL